MNLYLKEMKWISLYFCFVFMYNSICKT